MKKKVFQKRFTRIHLKALSDLKTLAHLKSKLMHSILFLLLFFCAQESLLQGSSEDPSPDTSDDLNLSDVNPEEKKDPIKELLKTLTGQASQKSTKKESDVEGEALNEALDTETDAPVTEGFGLRGLAEKLTALKEKLKALLDKVTGVPEPTPEAKPEPAKPSGTSGDEAPEGEQPIRDSDTTDKTDSTKKDQDDTRAQEELENRFQTIINEIFNKKGVTRSNPSSGKIISEDLMQLLLDKDFSDEDVSAIKQSLLPTAEEATPETELSGLVKKFYDATKNYKETREKVRQYASLGVIKENEFNNYFTSQENLKKVYSKARGLLNKENKDTAFLFDALLIIEGISYPIIMNQHADFSAEALTKNKVLSALSRLALNPDDALFTKQDIQKMLTTQQQYFDTALSEINQKIEACKTKMITQQKDQHQELENKLSALSASLNTQKEQILDRSRAEIFMQESIELMELLFRLQQLFVQATVLNDTDLQQRIKETINKIELTSEAQNNNTESGKIHAYLNRSITEIKTTVTNQKKEKQKSDKKNEKRISEFYYFKHAISRYVENITATHLTNVTAITQDVLQKQNAARSYLARYRKKTAGEINSVLHEDKKLKEQEQEKKEQEEEKQKRESKVAFHEQIKDTLQNYSQEITALITHVTSPQKDDTTAPLRTIAALWYCHELLDIQKAFIKKSSSSDGLGEEIKKQLTAQIDAITQSHGSSAQKENLKKILNFLQACLDASCSTKADAPTHPTGPEFTKETTNKEEQYVISALASYAEGLAAHFQKKSGTSSTVTPEELTWRMLKNSIASEIQSQASEYKKQSVRAEHAASSTSDPALQKKIKQFSQAIAYLGPCQEKLYNAITRNSTSEGGSFTDLTLLKSTTEPQTMLNRLFALPHGDNFLDQIDTEKITASMDKEWLRGMGEAATEYAQLLKAISLENAQLPLIIIKDNTGTKSLDVTQKISLKSLENQLDALIKKITENFASTTIKSFFEHLSENKLTELDNLLLQATSNNQAQEELRGFVDAKGNNLIHLLLNYGQINSSLYYKNNALINAPRVLSPGIDQGRSVIDLCSQLITRLISLGVNVHHENNRGLTPLAHALAGYYNKYLFAPLAAAGAWEYTSSDKKQNLFHILTKERKLSEYVEHHSFKDDKWYYIEGRVLDGISRTTPEKIQELLAAQDSAGCTPFDYALMHQDKRALEILLFIISVTASKTTSRDNARITETQESRKTALEKIQAVIEKYNDRLKLDETEKTAYQELVSHAQTIIETLITKNTIENPSVGHERSSPE